MSKWFRWNNKTKSNNKKRAKSQIAECSVPSFRIDLLCSPSQRWLHVVNSYHKEIKRLIQSILSLEQYQVSSDDQQNNAKNSNKNDENANFFVNLTIGIFQRLKKLGGNEYIEEMRGIAKLFKKDGFSIEHVLLTHLLYESFCGCTSICAKNNDNSLVLGRTLDWIDFDEQLLRNLTIDIEVYRGKQYLYRYTTFAGYIGALTALKFNQFGFAINFREFSTNPTNDTVHSADSWPIGFIGRYICEHCNDYESAMKMWNESPLMAPTFVIISGTQQSLLITRDEQQSLNPLTLNLQQEKKENNEIKYILQTNIDHWTYNYRNNKKRNKKKKKSKEKKQNDTMDSIRRLNMAHKCLMERHCNVNEEEMWKLLYEYPIHDRNWTIYTTVMNVQSGYYKTVRHIYK